MADLKPENFDEPNGSWLLRELEGVIDAIDRVCRADSVPSMTALDTDVFRSST